MEYDKPGDTLHFRQSAFRHSVCFEKPLGLLSLGGKSFLYISLNPLRDIHFQQLKIFVYTFFLQGFYFKDPSPRISI